MSLSDQKFSCRTSDGRFGTVTDFDGTSGAALGPARVTYIQVEGVANSNIKLYDGTRCIWNFSIRRKLRN